MGRKKFGRKKNKGKTNQDNQQNDKNKDQTEKEGFDKWVYRNILLEEFYKHQLATDFSDEEEYSLFFDTFICIYLDFSDSILILYKIF